MKKQTIESESLINDKKRKKLSRPGKSIFALQPPPLVGYPTSGREQIK